MKAPRFKLEQLPEHYRKQAEEQLRNEKTAYSQDGIRRNNSSVSECRKQKTLGVQKTIKSCMVDITGTLLIRITRQSNRILDDDNFSGGCKELRDAITTIIGRPGDSEKDGLFWEYKQKIGEPKTVIEVYKIGDKGNET